MGLTIPAAILERDYESVRAENPEAGLPPYADLTDEQKATHETIYLDTHAYFERLGQAISTGSPLPNPFDRPVKET